MKPSVSESTCLNAVRFRKMLAASRACFDDRIAQRVNELAPSNCRQFVQTLDAIHRQRQTDILYCIQVLSDKLERNGSDDLTRRERDILEGELVVESIVQRRSRDVVAEKCSGDGVQTDRL